MNQENNKSISEKLKDLEVEINGEKFTPSESLEVSKNWFLALPKVAQLAIGLIGIMITLSLIGTVFSLLRFLISLSILGVIIYVIYKFLNNQKTE